MLNELEEFNKLNTIEEMDKYINNNMEELSKLSLDQRQQIADIYLEKDLETIQKEWVNEEVQNIINTALDIGLRIILPDFLEDQVIELKNNILNNGLKDGLNKSLEDSLKTGKDTINLLSNNFESISDAKNAIKKGGTLDQISDLLDEGIKALKDNKIIDFKTAQTLKNGKNEIIKNVEKNIDNSFENQIKDFEKMKKNISNWKDAYNSQDFSSMQKEYNKMVKIMKELMPLENTINEFRTIENLQTLIKNNGKNFDLSEEALELANKLIN